MEKTAKIILASVMLSIVIISGVSFSAINFTNDTATGTAEIHDLTIMNAVFAESDNTAKLVKHTNIRGETVFVLSSTASALLERGYLVSNNALTQTSYDLDKRWSHIPAASGNLGSGISETIPWYEYDLPQYVKVGEEFTINVPYTYVKYDTNESDNPDDWEVDEIIKYQKSNIYDHDGTFFSVGYDDNLTWLNPSDEYSIHEWYNSQWDKKTYDITKNIHYDIENPHNIEVRFLLESEPTYPYNKFDLKIGQPWEIYYYMNYAGDGVYEISTTQILPNWGPGEEPQPPYPDRSIISMDEHPGYMEEKDIIRDLDAIAEELRDVNFDWSYDGLFSSIDEHLRLGYGNDTANNFLEKYPEFVGKFILPLLNWDIPQAHAQSSFKVVRGDVKIQESILFENPSVPLEVCIYDENLGDPGKYTQMTKLGGNSACEELENGKFMIVVNNTDPDKDGTSPDLSFQLFLQNENIELKKATNTDVTKYQSNTIKNPKYVFVDFKYGNAVNIQNTNDFFKPYKVFKTVQDTLTKFSDIGARNLPQLDVLYHTEFMVKRSPGQYMSNEIQFSDIHHGTANTRYVIDYPVWISHEVGHFLQDASYKHSKGSTGSVVGGCNAPDRTHAAHNAHVITTEQCAWSEGWATFVGLYANETPIDTTYINGYVQDFEKGTNNNILFPTDNAVATEGWITAMLWDLHDPVTTLDRVSRAGVYDNVNGLDRDIWTAFSTDSIQDKTSNHIATNILDFKADWDELEFTDISDIYELNNILLTTKTPTSGEILHIYSETFDNFDNWTLSGDENWDIVLPEEQYVPDKPHDNTVAHADDCDDECILTMSSSVDLSSYNDVELSFWRFIDASVDDDEGLKLEISINDGTTWTHLDVWSETTGHATDEWVHQKISLDNYLKEDVKIRFTAMASSSSEDLQIDDVMFLTSTQTVTTTTVYDEPFDSVSAWVQTGDNNWHVTSSWRESMPSDDSNNKILAANLCKNQCVLTSADIDLSSHSSATLELSRFVDSALDDDEYLAVEVYDGDNWVELARYSEDNDKNSDEWETESFDISSYLDDEFKIKITTQQSRSDEDVGIDYVRIVA